VKVVDDAVDPRAPFVEHLGCRLQGIQMGGRRRRRGIELPLQNIKALVEFGQQGLLVGTHGTTVTLKAGVVVVGGKEGRIQIDGTLHQSRLEAENRCL